LPQNPIVVWLRTFQVSESLEELQVREWQERGDVEEGVGTEIETEGETTEMS
jgi:hypothetical protein